MRRVRFRTLGCYPLTGAIESNADTLPAIIQEMLLTTHLRTSRPRHRSRRGGIDGEEEAGGILLMAAPVRRSSPPTSRPISGAHEHKSLLRFITCGSVDDGKSTLIGRLLYESKMVFEDQLAALEADSKQVGTQGGELDFALLVDGLAAEREQGITIDVAYRFFSTERRKFIVADTPGHEQYTRNMVTGASTADLAVILVDARKGVLTQTRRHSYLVSLLGIRQVVLAVNKLDLVGLLAVTSSIDIEATTGRSPPRSAWTDIICIPISALHGDNIIERERQHARGTAGRRCWSTSRAVDVDEDWPASRSGCRCNGSTARISTSGASAGMIAGRRRAARRPGRGPAFRAGRAAVARHRHLRRRSDGRVAGQSITVTLDRRDRREPRRRHLAAADAPPEVADQFEAHVIWMARRTDAARAALPDEDRARAPVGARSRSRSTRSTSTRSSTWPPRRLELNEIGVCNLELDRIDRRSIPTPRTATPAVSSSSTG